MPFVAGDVFDPAHLETVPPFYAPPETPVPQLNTLTSLNPLRGHVSAIHASLFFHLFDEEKQLQLARKLAGLLSPEPGSVIMGAHGGRPEKGLRTEVMRPNSHGITMFCHSPESLGRLFEHAFGGPDKIKFESRLITEPGGPTYFDTWPGNQKPFTCQEWSVVRL